MAEEYDGFDLDLEAVRPEGGDRTAYYRLRCTGLGAALHRQGKLLTLGNRASEEPRI